MIRVEIKADQEISAAATDFAEGLVHAVIALSHAQGKTVSMEVLIPKGDWPFGDHARVCGLGGSIEIRRGLEGPSFPEWREAQPLMSTPSDEHAADLKEPC